MFFVGGLFSLGFCLFFVFLVKGIESRALFMLSKHSTTETHSSSDTSFTWAFNSQGASRYHMGVLISSSDTVPWRQHLIPYVEGIIRP